MEDLKLFIQEEIVNVAFKKVGFDESLIKTKVLNSITVVDLVVSIEDKTGKQIPQHLINEENFDTINKMVESISKL